LKPVDLAHLYADACEQQWRSAADDLKAGRKTSFTTRLRLALECYMRGLWASLIATPEEVVHDASGEQPCYLLEKMRRIVFSQVLGEQAEQKVVTTPVDNTLDINFLLNTTAHSTAYVLPYAHFVSSEKLSSLETLLKLQAATVRKVARLLGEGAPRAEIILELRKFHKSSDYKSTKTQPV
jgi:hypothetical protein